MFTGCLPTSAMEYPFKISAPVEASLHVDPLVKRAVEPMLLGLNCSWPEGLYGKTGFNNPEAKKLIRAFRPVALRFPHGVWANFYDWESDGRRITDNYETPYDDAVKDHPNLKYGFQGFHSLHAELGFDVIFTWNVNYDSPEKGARRLLDLREKGFRADRIELGNEIFWKTQRSEAVSDESKYIAVSKAHTAALKEIDPAIQVSVPVHWRDARTNPWNLALKGESYFDAVTVHKYVHNMEKTKGAEEALSARQEILGMVSDMEKIFPGKPIWLSEWAVGCQDERLSIIGMMDAWLTILDHPQSFAIADYFQMNAEQALIRYDRKTGTHTRTGFGVAYEILRSVFFQSEIIASSIKSTKIGNDLNGVSAMAVQRDGDVFVLAINLTNRSADFRIEFNNNITPMNVSHETYIPESDESIGMNHNVLEKIAGPESGSTIILPPLSINRIQLKIPAHPLNPSNQSSAAPAN